MKINGVPNDRLPTGAQEKKPKKKVRDFVAEIQRGLAEIRKKVDNIETQTLVVDEAVKHVQDEDARGDLDLLGITCFDETRQIEETLDQLESLIDRLARKAEAAEAAAARGEPFIRKRTNNARDAEIGRLHDERNLSFGQIAIKLGMKYDAVRKAYHRDRAAASKSGADKSSCPQPDTSKRPR